MAVVRKCDVKYNRMSIVRKCDKYDIRMAIVKICDVKYGMKMATVR